MLQKVHVNKKKDAAEYRIKKLDTDFDESDLEEDFIPIQQIAQKRRSEKQTA